MKILKFGGSSVGTPEGLTKVIQIISDRVKKGDTLSGVVVSAFSEVTNILQEMVEKAAAQKETAFSVQQDLEGRHLAILSHFVPAQSRAKSVALVKSLFNELEDTIQAVATLRQCTPQIRDLIMSYGERLSALILVEILKTLGLNASYVDARMLIKTDSSFGNARVNFEKTYPLLTEYFRSSESLPIITGYIGSDDDNQTTTLGRGGSDYTASIVGAALNVQLIEIWTDVDGVLTADPRFVKSSLPIPALSYEEAMELSYFGAKVIYPPTLLPAYKASIPVLIKNTFNAGNSGSLIQRDTIQHPYPVTGISSIAEVSLIRIEGAGMQGVPGTAERLFRVLSQNAINVILISQASSEHSICIAVSPGSVSTAQFAIQKEFSRELENGEIQPIVIDNDCSVISAVGQNMQNTLGISARLFKALADNGINVIAIAQGSSELNISAVIPRKTRAKALNAVHDAFFLSELRTAHVFIIGNGLIAGTLLKQIREHSAHLKKAYHIDLKVLGLTTTSKMIFRCDDAGGGIRGIEEDLVQSGTPASLAEFVKNIQELNLPKSIVVDCSASDDVPIVYPQLLHSSISIVTPNKRGFSADNTLSKTIKEAARKGNANLLYETCVGAGLPVLSTLRDLLKSGDEVISIEGVLSGTLSYIFNTFAPGCSFAQIVSQAVSLGYTEPDPRDDLNGIDVARKLLILARELGRDASLDDVEIESLVPAECRSCTKEDFISLLTRYEAVIVQKNEEAHRQGRKLCYMASIRDGKISTGVEAIDAQHPFYRLSGADNIISFRTARYNARPLIVQGPGAGADVTAAGVFADIVRIAS